MRSVEQSVSHGISEFYLKKEAGCPSTWIREGFSPEWAEQVTSCVEWASTFPQQRVQKQRRIEALCPMVGPSLADRSFYFATSLLEEREPALETLDEVLRKAAKRFEAEIHASDPRLRCLTLVLPGVKGARLLEATDPHRSIKGELLAKGILVGEFFPSCPFATTFNPKLFALRSPAPMYVLRTLLEGDWRFICQVPEWQEIYRKQFGDPPRHLRHLGGPWWRIAQKFQWKFGALRNCILPPSKEDSFPVS